MDRDFFIKLTLGAYRVTDILPSQSSEKAAQEGEPRSPRFAGEAGQRQGEIRSLANSVLARLILFSEINPVTQEQKQSLIPQIQREINSLVRYFIELKNSGKIETKYSLILEKEYQKVAQWLNEQQAQVSMELPKPGLGAPKPGLGMEDNSLSERQRKIMGILQNKEKTQVWELQKVLTEVTKRTLRRDLDDLLQHNLIERKGEWNAVFYRLKTAD